MDRESIEKLLRWNASLSEDPDEANEAVDRYLAAYDENQKLGGVVVVKDGCSGGVLEDLRRVGVGMPDISPEVFTELFGGEDNG